jgi:hypothetical protein
LIGEILDFTQGSHPDGLLMTGTDYAEFVRHVERELRAEVTLKSVQLELENLPPAAKLHLNPKRLWRVFDNLIANATDAIEFLIAGASLVGVGTALFYEPLICPEINQGIAAYLREAQLTNVWALLSNEFAVIAWVHTILAGLIFGTTVVLGVSCWHILRGRNVELFRRGAALALIVAVPATLIQLSVGNRFGEAVTSAQGMKIAASEAQWNTCQPCGFSVFQIGGFTTSDETPSFSITIPRLLSYMADGSFDGQVQGLNELQKQEQRKYGRGNYIPNVEVIYWSMRVMAFAGVLMFLVAALGAWLYWRKKLERARWFHRTAIVGLALPYIAATAGWILTEMGRQPWIVNDLLKTADANSPVSTIAARIRSWLRARAKSSNSASSPGT